MELRGKPSRACNWSCCIYLEAVIWQLQSAGDMHWKCKNGTQCHHMTAVSAVLTMLMGAVQFSAQTHAL